MCVCVEVRYKLLVLTLTFDCIFRAVVITAHICENTLKVTPLIVAEFATSSSCLQCCHGFLWYWKTEWGPKIPTVSLAGPEQWVQLQRTSLDFILRLFLLIPAKWGFSLCSTDFLWMITMKKIQWSVNAYCKITVLFSETKLNVCKKYFIKTD